MSGPELLLVDSSAQGAAACVVCGSDIPAASGVTALFDGRWTASGTHPLKPP